MKMNVQEVLTVIEAESRVAPNDLRFVRTMDVGGPHLRQGDILIWRIPSVPEGSVRRAHHQLALGTSAGSRHLIGPKARVYDLPEKLRHRLLGPVIELDEREVGTHPEHAHYSLPPGCYQVGYQQDMRTREAVRD